MADPDVWYRVASRDGALVRLDDLALHVESQSIRYGLSVFEGVRGYVPDGGGTARPFAVDDHVRRLAESARLAALPDVDVDRAVSWVHELFAHVRPADDCYLRIALSPSAWAGIGDTPDASLTMTLRRMGRKPAGPLSMAVGPRKADGPLPARCKCVAHYAGTRVALVEARRRGFDSVLLRSPEGHLAEAPTANVMLVRGGEILTPRLCDAVLPGITRHTLLRLAADAGRVTREVALDVADLGAADEVFLCGTGIEVRSVDRVEDTCFTSPGPVAAELSDRYLATVRGCG